MGDSIGDCGSLLFSQASQAYEKPTAVDLHQLKLTGQATEFVTGGVASTTASFIFY